VVAAVEKGDLDRVCQGGCELGRNRSSFDLFVGLTGG
jgi:hypothetical protein